MRNTLNNYAQKVAVILTGLFLVAGIAFAADTFSEPTAAAPGGNVSAPVNVGGTLQVKTGDFWANKVGSSNGFVVGDGTKARWFWDMAGTGSISGDGKATVQAEKFCTSSNPSSCVTSLSGAGGGSATCKMNTYVKESTGNGWTPYDPGSGSGDERVGAGCALTPTEQANGWFLMSWEHCSNVRSRDCSGPAYCHYGQIQCDGSVTIVAGTQSYGNGPLVPPTQAELQAQCASANGTWTAGTGGGSGFCTYPEPAPFVRDPINFDANGQFIP